MKYGYIQHAAEAEPCSSLPMRPRKKDGDPGSSQKEGFSSLEIKLQCDWTQNLRSSNNILCHLWRVRQYSDKDNQYFIAYCLRQPGKW